MNDDCFIMNFQANLFSAASSTFEMGEAKKQTDALGLGAQCHRGS